MLIRIEFDTHKSARFPWALRLCRKFPSYNMVQEDGITIHSIEFTEKELKQFEAIHKVLYGLPRVAYFVDGQLVAPGEIFTISWENQKRERLDKWAAAQQERERLRAYFHRDPTGTFLARLKKYGLMGDKN